MKFKRDNARHVLTRLSLASIFLGIGVWEIIDPASWSFYVPTIIASHVNANLFTTMQGGALVVLGLAVLLGIYLRVAAALSALMMVAILADLVTQFGFTDIVIRDFTVFLIALALYFDDNDYMRLRK